MRKTVIRNSVADLIVLTLWFIGGIFTDGGLNDALIVYLLMRILHILEGIGRKAGAYDDVFISVERK